MNFVSISWPRGRGKQRSYQGGAGSLGPSCPCGIRDGTPDPRPPPEGGDLTSESQNSLNVTHCHTDPMPQSSLFSALGSLKPLCIFFFFFGGSNDTDFYQSPNGPLFFFLSFFLSFFFQTEFLEACEHLRISPGALKSPGAQLEHVFNVYQEAPPFRYLISHF